MADLLFSWNPGTVATLLTTTMENRDITEVQDAVFSKLVLLDYLTKKNKVTRSGGASIIVPIRQSANSTAGFYDGYQTITTTPQENETAGQYTWKQAAASVSVSGRESRIQNNGKYAVIDLVKQKIKDAEASLRNTINTALFAASPGSTDIGSLVTSIDATSTIGDINSTTYSFWQATSTASGSFAAQGLSDMRTLWNTLEQRSMDTPTPTDLILTTSAIYNFYEGSLVPQQRYTNSSTADASFENLKFRSAPVKYDSQATSGVMYFLNSDVMELDIHSGTDFIMTEWVKPANQDARVAQFLVALELVIKNRRKLGKLTGITA